MSVRRPQWDTARTPATDEGPLNVASRAAAAKVRELLDPVLGDPWAIETAHDALLELTRGPRCLVCAAVGTCFVHDQPTAPAVRRLPARVRADLLSSATAAAVLDVTPATVRRWAAAGRIDAERRGRRWTFDPAHVGLVAHLRATEQVARRLAPSGAGR